MTRRERNIWKRKNKQRLRWERRHSRNARKMLDEQLKATLSLIESLGLKEAFESVSFLVPDNDAKDLLKEIHDTTGRFFYQETIKQTTRQFKNITTPYTTFLNAFLLQFTAEKVRSITDTTKQILKEEIAITLNQGLSIPAAVKQIRKRVRAFNRNRANVIARTEVISASNFADLAGAQVVQKELGLQIEKTWLATPDSRTRSSHIAANGQRQELDQPFIVQGERLQYAGDPNGSASNVINCRCTQYYQEKL